MKRGFQWVSVFCLRFGPGDLAAFAGLSQLPNGSYSVALWPTNMIVWTFNLFFFLLCVFLPSLSVQETLQNARSFDLKKQSKLKIVNYFSGEIICLLLSLGHILLSWKIELMCNLGNLIKKQIIEQVDSSGCQKKKNKETILSHENGYIVPWQISIHQIVALYTCPTKWLHHSSSKEDNINLQKFVSGIPCIAICHVYNTGGTTCNFQTVKILHFIVELYFAPWAMIKMRLMHQVYLATSSISICCLMWKQNHHLHT